ETAADRIGELVDLDEVLRRRIHRRADLRPLHRAADDGEGPAAIDDRLDANRLIDLRSRYQWSGGRRGLGRHVPPAEQGRPRDSIAHQEQLARGETFGHLSSFRGASPLDLPHTLSREPLRRLAPFAWLASLRSLASSIASPCLAVAVAYFIQLRSQALRSRGS